MKFPPYWGYTRGGIRTHEAEAEELKSTPFDHSGTSANNAQDGIRTHEALRTRT